MQAGSILGFRNSIRGENDCSGLAGGADIVVITAGFARKPGMSRLDLLKKNSEVVSSVVEGIAENAPDSIIIVVTNPLDVMTYVAVKKSGFSSQRVLGQAGILDGARFKYFASVECGCLPSDVSTFLLGGHGDSMVPVISRTTVSGKAMKDVLPEEKVNMLVEKTRGGGAEIVSLLRTGSAYYAPASSVLSMIEAISGDTGEVMPCSVYLNGEYGLKDVCIGVPVRLGKGGVKEIINIDLNDEEMKALHKSAGIYKKSIAEVYHNPGK